MKYTGQIQLILGPMFSGKSTELLRKVKRFQHAKKKVFVINFAHDNRYSQQSVIATHDKCFYKAVKAYNITSQVQEALKYDVVAIDQGQFFPDIHTCAQELANHGKIVLIAALDGTFKRQPFGRIFQLIPRCENIVKLSAVCHKCSQPAFFSKRLINDERVQVVGGSQSYQPMCRKCFHQ